MTDSDGRPARLLALVLLIAAIVLAPFGSPADGAITVPPLTDLGTLGGATAYATGVNDAGTVVGYSELAGGAGPHPFSYDLESGTMRDLGLLPGGTAGHASDVNEAGLVIGTTTTGPVTRDAFVFDLTTGVMTELDLGGPDDEAWAIDEAGVVVGAQGTSFTDLRAVAHDLTTGATIDLGTLGGTTSIAYGINDSGIVVGQSAVAGDLELHAFAYDLATATMTDLGTLGGGLSSAWAVNDEGVVVGEATLPGNAVTHAFAYDLRTATMTDLGTLGGTSSSAHDINDDGTIVGSSHVAGDTDIRAFVRFQGETTLTDAGSLGGGGSAATAVSNRDVVVGSARNPGTQHDQHAFAVTLLAPTAAPILSGAATCAGNELVWTAPPVADSPPLDRYAVRRDGDLILTTTADVTSLTDPTTGSHTYTVTASNAAGDGPASAPLVLTTADGCDPPPTPVVVQPRFTG